MNPAKNLTRLTSLLFVLGMSLPASGTVQATFRVHGVPENVPLTNVVPGDAVWASLAFDQGWEGYISVRVFVQKAGEDREREQFINLNCRPVQGSENKLYHSLSIGVGPQAKATRNVPLEIGDVLILKVCPGHNQVLAQQSFPVVASRAPVESPTTTAPPIPSIHDLLEAGHDVITGLFVSPHDGRLQIRRRRPDGTEVRSTAGVTRGTDGSIQVSESDANGVRRETRFQPDGVITISESNPDLSSSEITVQRDGSLLRTDRSPEGYHSDHELRLNGEIVTTRHDLDGSVLETVIQEKEGATLRTDRHGETTRIHVDDNGVKTTTQTDIRNNVRTTKRDRNNRLIEETRTQVAPVEAGREYYEKVLGGDDWLSLPKYSRERYGDLENSQLQTQKRAAQNRARALANERARTAEKAKHAANDQVAWAKHEAKLAALQKAQAEADKKSAAEQARWNRKRELDESFTTARNLNDQHRKALQTKDLKAAARIAVLQERHHEKSQALLRMNLEEDLEMKRLATLRSNLTRKINASANPLADRELQKLKSMQDAKVLVAKKSQAALIGAEMQLSTNNTTRMAERARVHAYYRLQEIDRLLADEQLPDEQRKILLQKGQVLLEQLDGAERMLHANGRITAAAYTIDAALIVSGTKLVQGAKAVTTAAAAKAFAAPTARNVSAILTERRFVDLAKKALR